MANRFEYRRSVTHSCGHSVKHILRARYRQEADDMAHHLRKIDCPECMARRVNGNRERADEEQRVGLPQLTGSRGQTRWGSAIRARIFNALLGSRYYEKYASFCRYETSAAWWIDHRSGSLSSIVSHLRAVTPDRGMP